jgi:Skp family chaperone for outer membrane proteins
VARVARSARARTRATGGAYPGLVAEPLPPPGPFAEWGAAPEVGPLPAPRPRSSRPLVIALVLVLALAGGLTGYLLHTTAAWRTAAGDWQSLAERHGTELAQTRADLDAATTELTATRDQLAAAQGRITQLADEKAQLGDTSAAQQQMTDYQARVSAAAGTVATALAACVQGQDRLIGYLGEKDKYDPASLATFTSQVQALCAQATSANDALQRELSK